MKNKLLRNLVVMSKYTFLGMILQCAFAALLLADPVSGQKLEHIPIAIEEENISLKDLFQVME